MFKIAFVVALVGAGATAVFMYARMDDEIRRHVEGLLARQFPEFSVSVGGARRIDGKGIAIYDLTLAQPRSDGKNSPLVSVDELLLCCEVDLPTLVQGAPQVHRVEIRGPELTLRRRSSGQWNIAALLPLKPCGTAIPVIVIRDGSLSVADAEAGDSQPLLLRDINFTVTPTAQAAVVGSWPTVNIEGTLGGPQVKRIDVQATVDGPSRRCTASVKLAQLQLNQALLAAVRHRLPASMQQTNLSAVIDGSAALRWQPDSGAPPTAEGTLLLSEGRLENPRLPRPITELTGRIALDVNHLRIEEMTGKCGMATVAISLNRAGWSADAPIALAAYANDAPLDRELYTALPPVLRTEWDKYQPSGFVNATLQARYDGKRWKPCGLQPGQPAAKLVGRNLSFQSDKYSYRLTGGSGTIAYFAAEGEQPPRLDIDLTAQGGGQPLHIVGQVTDPRPGAAGWAEITGENVQIELAMIEAMPLKPRDVITKLHPTGRLHVRWRIDRSQAGAEPRKTLRLDLIDVHINYDEFPYPLEGIRGSITADDDRWTFTELVSSGAHAIRGEGFLQPCPSGTELYLRFVGQQVPLDRALFDALREPVQRGWQQLRPTGEIDLTAEVRHRTGQGAPNIAVSVYPRPESAQLRPDFFDYRMDKVAGAIHYQDGRVRLDGVTAQHDAVNIATNGDGVFSPDGGWEFQLVGLRADNLAASPDLLRAMPERLSRLADTLEPTGSFTLHQGILSFRKPASEIAPLETRWDMQVDCHQADLHCGLDLQNIHGSIRLIGASDGQRSQSEGELNLESVTFKDVQLTDVRGPLWVDETECRLGRWAGEKTGQQPSAVTAKAYGGAVAAHSWVKFSGLPEYGCEASLVGADLRRIIVERFGGQQSFNGKVDADVVLSGAGPSLPRLGGEGHVHIRDANIYELPQLVSLLAILRTGATDKTAFNQSDVAFRIQGQHIYLDQIDFLGDAVNLYGKGETSFDQNLNLVFSADMARRDFHLPLVGGIVGQAREQFLRIYVGGTVKEPIPTTEALPGFNDMLKQLRTDIRPASTAPSRQAGLPPSIGQSIRAQ